MRRIIVTMAALVVSAFAAHPWPATYVISRADTGIPTSMRYWNVDSAATLQGSRDTADTLRAYAQARIHDSLAALTPARIGAAPAFSSGAGNLFWATPNGSAGSPGFRAIAAPDIPILNQNTTGSAAKWTTARTLSYTGDATGSMSVDGAGNASAALTLANSGISAGTYALLTVDSKGRATAGASVNDVNHGGTGQSGFLYSFAIPYNPTPSSFSAIAPNTTTTKKLLSMTGTGSAGAAPAWTTLAASDISGLAAIATSASASDLGSGIVPTGRMPGLTGDVTSSGGGVATTLAKIQGVPVLSLTSNGVMQYVGGNIAWTSVPSGPVWSQGGVLGGIGYGTSGQVLASAGASTAPVWTSPTHSIISDWASATSGFVTGGPYLPLAAGSGSPLTGSLYGTSAAFSGPVYVSYSGPNSSYVGNWNASNYWGIGSANDGSNTILLQACSPAGVATGPANLKVSGALSGTSANFSSYIYTTKTPTASVAGSGPYYALTDASSPTMGWVMQLGPSNTLDWYRYSSGWSAPLISFGAGGSASFSGALSGPSATFSGSVTTGSVTQGSNVTLTNASATQQTITANGLTITMPAPFAGGLFIFNFRGIISTTFAYSSAIIYNRGSLTSSYSLSSTNVSSLRLTSDGTYWFLSY